MLRETHKERGERAEITDMEFLWIPISLLAGLMQAVRTAAQKALNARLSTWMVTYVRSLYGLPVMIVYLALVIRWEGIGTPDFHTLYFLHCFMAGASQVVATYLLIQLFAMSNFAVGTMLTKTDIMQAAIIGSVLFSESISWLGWIAIILSILGVLLISATKSRAALGGGLRTFLLQPATLTGLASAFLFCLSYLFLREASLSLGEATSPIYRGAWSVVVVTAMQCVFLGLWLLWTERAEFAKLGGVIGPSVFIGVTSAIGSIGWFTAMAMQNASYVKAVGQVEVVFTILISTLYFHERIRALEYLGIAVIVAAVLIFGLEHEIRAWL